MSSADATLELFRPSLSDRLLTREPRQRARLVVTLISAITYVLYTGIIAVTVWLGLSPHHWWVVLGLAGLVINLAFFGLIRSGITRDWRDPALSNVQFVVGVLFMLATYVYVGPASGATLIALASLIVYAMFALSPRDVWSLTGFVLAALGLTMLVCGHVAPERFRADVQLVGFLYAALVLPLITLLATRVTRMRQRMQAQRIELKAALEKLREQATRDELTLTHNRRHMMELLVLQHEQQRRLDTPLALALLDLDRFKRINDQHGHLTGDAVLRRFADTARDGLRAVDLLSRWGGEEFVVLFPGAQVGHAQAALQRLQRALAETDLSELGIKSRLSFSAGLVALSPSDSIELALERADQAMYRAKAGGRCRTELG
jgi:diguanylate cyclase (GGDEF)-like protein